MFNIEGLVFILIYNTSLYAHHHYKDSFFKQIMNFISSKSNNYFPIKVRVKCSVLHKWEKKRSLCVKLWKADEMSGINWKRDGRVIRKDTKKTWAWFSYFTFYTRHSQRVLCPSLSSKKKEKDGKTTLATKPSTPNVMKASWARRLLRRDSISFFF